MQRNRRLARIILLGSCIGAWMSGSKFAVAGVAIITAPTVAPRATQLYGPLTTGLMAITNAGVAVGQIEHFNPNSTSQASAYYVVRWDRNGNQAVLGDLGKNGAGDPSSIIRGLAQDGTTFGYANAYAETPKGAGTFAVRWDPGQIQPQILDPLSTQDGSSYAVLRDSSNTHFATGTAIQYASPTPNGSRAVRWLPDGSIQELGTPNIPGATSYDMHGTVVNDAGTVAGWVESYGANGSLGRRALRWDAGSTTPVDLGPGGALIPESIISINSAGTIIGAVEINGKYSPARWEPGSTAPTKLGTLGSSRFGGGMFTVRGLNEGGDVVGSSHAYDNNQDLGERAVVWPAGTSAPIELPHAPASSSFDSSFAASINESGSIVGTDQYRAVFWTPDRHEVQLSSLLPVGSNWLWLQTASDLSDTGWIVGVGRYDPDGSGPTVAMERHYSLLVPEAGTYGRGDANFDTVVNFTDLVILAQHYNQSNPTQDVNVGDFDLNGVTNFQDLVTLAQHYGSGASSSVTNSGDPSLAGAASPGFASDWAIAQSLVPEPASMVTALGAAVGGLTVRRRRRV